MSVERSPLLQHAPIFVMPLLVVALSASLAKLLWMIVAPVEDVSAAPIVAAAPPIVTQQKPNFGRIIANTHLFGKVTKVVPVRTTTRTQQAPPPIVPTQPPVKLSLHGLWAKKNSEGRTDISFKSQPINDTKGLVAKIAADLDSLFVLNVLKSVKNIPSEKSQSRAFAIISLAGGEQKTYSEGENITDKVKVLEIFSDKVTVENRGLRQEIFLVEGRSTPLSYRANSPVKQSTNSYWSGTNRPTAA